MPDDSRQKSPAGDDRNLVIVDEDFAQADSEDRLWLFWERNRERIINGTVAVVVGLIAWFAVQSWAEARAAGLRETFAEIRDDAGRLAFAAENPGEVLSAVALVEVADNLKTAGKPAIAAYDDAAEAAEAAGEDATVRALGWRARLYAGLLAAETGDAGAVARLARVADATAAPDALRGQAMLALARAALAKSDVAGARSWLDKMDRQLGATHPWRDEQRRLIASEPALRPSATNAR